MSKVRLTDYDVTTIVRELERWRDGQLGSKLTWKILEKNYGYSRQALHEHARISSAYKLAKTALRAGLVKTRSECVGELELLRAEIKALKATVGDYVIREREWQMKWQRIAFHFRAKNFNFSAFDNDITTIPNKKKTEEILKPFNQPMTPNGRE